MGNSFLAFLPSGGSYTPSNLSASRGMPERRHSFRIADQTARHSYLVATLPRNITLVPLHVKHHDRPKLLDPHASSYSLSSGTPKHEQGPPQRRNREGVPGASGRRPQRSCTIRCWWVGCCCRRPPLLACIQVRVCFTCSISTDVRSGSARPKLPLHRRQTLPFKAWLVSIC